MSNIFSKIGGGSRFRPATITDLFALMLSRALKDPTSVWVYRHLTERHSIPVVLDALHGIPADQRDSGSDCYLQLRDRLEERKP
jgi:hypothetical protein